MDGSREVYINNRCGEAPSSEVRAISEPTGQQAEEQEAARRKYLEVFERLGQAVRPQHPRVRDLRVEGSRKPTPR